MSALNALESVIIDAWACKYSKDAEHDLDTAISHIFCRLHNLFPKEDPELFGLFRTKYLAFCKKFRLSPEAGWDPVTDCFFDEFPQP